VKIFDHGENFLTMKTFEPRMVAELIGLSITIISDECHVQAQGGTIPHVAGGRHR
jgi:hypothetical protein